MVTVNEKHDIKTITIITPKREHYFFEHGTWERKFEEEYKEEIKLLKQENKELKERIERKNKRLDTKYCPCCSKNLTGKSAVGWRLMSFCNNDCLDHWERFYKEFNGEVK